MTVCFPKDGMVDLSPLNVVPFEPTVDMDCFDEMVLKVFERVTEGAVPVLWGDNGLVDGDSRLVLYSETSLKKPLLPPYRGSLLCCESAETEGSGDWALEGGAGALRGGPCCWKVKSSRAVRMPLD
jgi:hypothetical protein